MDLEPPAWQSFSFQKPSAEETCQVCPRVLRGEGEAEELGPAGGDAGEMGAEGGRPACPRGLVQEIT